MTEHVIPNMNPHLMLGIWIEQKDNGDDPAELLINPIIGFVMSTEPEHQEGRHLIPARSMMIAVISPIEPDGMALDHEQFRLYDSASGMVYDGLGDHDHVAMESMRERARRLS